MENVKYRTVSKFNITLKKNDFIFGCFYFVTLLMLLLDQVDTAAVFTSVLRRVKYVYIALMAVYFVASVLSGSKGKVKITTATWVTAILLLHTVLFGYVFTNDIVIDATHYHALQLLIFLSFGYFTYYYVNKSHCLHLFIAFSYAACLVTLVYAFLTHLGEGMNIFWGISNMFSGNSRYRATYGFTHGGYLSYHCFVTMTISLFLFRDIKGVEDKRHRQILRLILLVCDLFVLMFLIMAAERSGFLSTVIVFALYFIISYLKKKNVKFTKKFLISALVIVGIILLVLGFTGALTYIWENSARSLNIDANYPVFQQLGNFWTGMGYVENSGFQKSNSVFGITTSSLDIYYVYIFFTTGFIGCVMIGAVILIILLSLFFNTEKKYGIEALSLFCGMLFFAFWQCNFLNYRYQPGIILFILLLCMIDNKRKKRSNKIVWKR